MEYSVFDLVRILIRKWYVIVAAAVLIGGVSVFTARSSYQQALQNYELYTTETVPMEDTGTLSATIHYSYALTDYSEYVEEARDKMNFINAFYQALGVEEMAFSIEDYAIDAYTNYASVLENLPMDSRITAAVQHEITALGYMEPAALNEQGEWTEPNTVLSVGNHLTITPVTNGQINLTVTGVEEIHARDILESYIKNLSEFAQDTYQIEIHERDTTTIFTPDPVQYTESAQFAQTVMQRPEQAPIYSKTIGTAVMYSFVAACFGILVYTFAKDSRKQATANTETNNHA